MNIMKTSMNQNFLYDKGILLPSGEICRNKINLISGAMTTPFVETIRTFSENDSQSMERISAALNHMYQKGQEAEMMAILRILFDVLGLQFPEDAELMIKHPEAWQYFLFSFLLDMDDCMQDLMAEFTSV
jgi:hypothetical protein